MKILFAIPSKNRVEILKKFTYAWLQNLPFDWAVFVEPQDFKAYEDAGIKNLVCIDDNNKGLCYAKSQIKKYAIKNKYDLIFKVDDDTKAFTDYRNKTDAEKTVKVLEKFIPQAILKFKKHDRLGAIAFPYSFHLFDKVEWKPVKKLQSCYLIRAEHLVNEKYMFEVFEDFGTGLDLLVKGFKIFKHCLIGIEQGVAVGEGTGGLQDFDRAEIALRSADTLRRLYPPLNFKAVDKIWRIEPDIRSIKL